MKEMDKEKVQQRTDVEKKREIKGEKRITSI